MKSITYNEVSTDEIVEIIAKHTQKYNTDENRVIIGTDSQNFCKTNIGRRRHGISRI
jgi:predicted RNase H-related nuclease YkuK (DUF458 family)